VINNCYEFDVLVFIPDGGECDLFGERWLKNAIKKAAIFRIAADTQ